MHFIQIYIYVTPLYFAIINENLDIIKLFLEKKDLDLSVRLILNFEDFNRIDVIIEYIQITLISKFEWNSIFKYIHKISNSILIYLVIK